jgi:hypothetical protein
MDTAGASWSLRGRWRRNHRDGLGWRRCHADRLWWRRHRRWFPGRNRRWPPRSRCFGNSSAPWRGGDHRRHERAVRVAVGQPVTAAHYVVAAGNQVRQPRVRGHAGVDDGNPHPGASSEAPRLGQVEHVHVLRLNPKVAARQYSNLGAVRILLHRLGGSRRAVWRHCRRVDSRRVDRVSGRPGQCDRRHDQCGGGYCGRTKRPQFPTTGTGSLHKRSSTTMPAGRSASGRGIQPTQRACGTAGCRWCWALSPQRPAPLRE